MSTSIPAADTVSPASGLYIDRDGQRVEFNHETWRTMDAYFECTPHPHKDPVSIQRMGRRLADPQIAPYDQALDTIRDIVLRNEPLVTYGGVDRQNPTLKLEVAFQQVKYDENPIVHGVHGITERLTPAIARRLAMTYATTIFVDLQYTLSIKNEQGQWETHPPRVVSDFQLGKIPIMLGSRLDNGPGRIPGFAHQAGECQYDCGGYYIISGLEKVTVAREKMIENYPMVFEMAESSSPGYTDECVVRSVPDEGRYHGDCSIKVYMNRRPGQGQIGVRFGNLKVAIPLFAVFRALGVAVDQDIFRMCVQDLDDEELIEMLMPSLQDAKDTPSVEAARRFVLAKLQSSTGVERAPPVGVDPAVVEQRAFQYLDNSILKYLYPHVGENFEHKAAYLGYCVNKLLNCVLRRRNYDDRDHMGFKKVETSGVLLANLFHQVFKNKVLIEMKHDLHKALTQPLASRSIQVGDIEGILRRVIKSDLLDPVRVAFRTSKWGFSKSNAAAAIKQGVSQQLQRINNKGAISHVRKLVTPIDGGNSKAVAGPHKLHGSQYGFICPAETPDGEQIGITKHLALTSTFTVYTNSNLVRDALADLGIVPLGEVVTNLGVLLEGHKVFLNGRWEGIHRDPSRLVEVLRKYRRNGVLHPHTGVYWNILHREIFVWTTGGRIVRPLYIVDQPGNRLRMTKKVFEDLAVGKMGWDDLISGKRRLSTEAHGDPEAQLPSLDPEALEDSAYLEYVDTQEAENLMVAMTVDDLSANRADEGIDSYVEYTHCEIHPSLMLSAVIGDVPFPNHCQSPRVIYWGNMGRQSIGYHATNFKQRMDMVSYQLHYPQLPLVSTRPSRYAMSRELPAGQMAIVAIACYTGYNQEDSTVICSDSIDRGLFLRTVRKVHKDEEKKNYGEATEEQIRYPDKNTAQMKSNYDAIDPETGLPIRGRFVKNGDVILSKIVKTKGTKESQIRFRDISVYLRHGDEGIIDNVEMSTTGEGYKCVRVSIRQERVPQIGDKFACYTPDHDVLTTRGWVPIDALTLDDKVATLVDEALVYQKPSALQAYDYDDKLYKVETNHVDLMVTPNHRMFVRPKQPATAPYRIREARDIYHIRQKYKKNVDVWSPDYTSPELPWNLVVEDGKITHFRFPAFTDGHGKARDELVLPIDAWLTIYGIYLAEGNVRQYQIQIAANKPRVQAALDLAVGQTGLNMTKCLDKEERTQWNIWGMHLARHLGEGFTTKSMKDWVWWLNRDQARLLIHSMCLGDGTPMGQDTWRYSTSSDQLADQLQRLCLHAGWSCNKTLRFEAGTDCGHLRPGSKTTADHWVLGIITVQNEPIVNKYITPEGEHAQDAWVDYKGRVYCCTVPQGAGVIYVRRNGKPIWCAQSRASQKGTLGLLLNKEDMPYTKDGLTPDLIINPHAMPSRMTVSMLMEILLGKACATKGFEGDGTPFNGTQIEDIARILGAPVEKGGCGMTEITRADGEFGWGHEVMYSGFTGEQFPVRIFAGPCFYVSLKHMVSDKIHSRSTGMVQPISRQPAEGRSRDGGLRLGEMERDVILAHGAASFLQDKMLLCSDLYECWFDRDTGTIAIGNPENNSLREGTRDCVPVAIPWSLKTLLQELMAIGIKTTVTLK